MLNSDVTYLEEALRAFVNASINRVAHSGDMQYAYRLSADSIKRATGRQRLHDTVIEDYGAFLKSCKVDVDYDPDFAQFNVHLDLARCVLDPTQAADLSVAMSYFRAEHL